MCTQAKQRRQRIWQDLVVQRHLKRLGLLDGPEDTEEDDARPELPRPSGTLRAVNSWVQGWERRCVKDDTCGGLSAQL